MISNKPYLIRAFYQWITDCSCTPFIVINANFPHCEVPEEYVEDGEITLNISSTAIRDLKLGNEFVEFKASFSGMVYTILAPVKAVLSIYAQENQQGMFFDYDEPDEADMGMLPVNQKEKRIDAQNKNRGHLKLVE